MLSEPHTTTTARAGSSRPGSSRPRVDAGQELLHHPRVAHTLLEVGDMRALLEDLQPGPGDSFQDRLRARRRDLVVTAAGDQRRHPDPAQVAGAVPVAQPADHVEL